MFIYNNESIVKVHAPESGVFRKTHYIHINSKYYAWNNKEG